MHRRCRLVAALLVASGISFDLTLAGAVERPRLAVLTDIGGDPDDQQSLIRLMLYANELEIELLIGLTEPPSVDAR